MAVSVSGTFNRNWKVSSSNLHIRLSLGARMHVEPLLELQGSPTQEMANLYSVAALMAPFKSLAPRIIFIDLK